MKELIQKVIQWAADRNILEGSTPIKQLDKTSEEFNELQRAVAVHQFITNTGGYPSFLAKGEVEDAFGDILVTLIIAAKQLDLDIEDCLASAYEEIKDRKGKMINGKFIKEADL